MRKEDSSLRSLSKNKNMHGIFKRGEKKLHTVLYQAGSVGENRAKSGEPHTIASLSYLFY